MKWEVDLSKDRIPFGTFSETLFPRSFVFCTTEVSFKNNKHEKTRKKHQKASTLDRRLNLEHGKGFSTKNRDKLHRWEFCKKKSGDKSQKSHRGKQRFLASRRIDF